MLQHTLSLEWTKLKTDTGAQKIIIHKALECCYILPQRDGNMVVFSKSCHNGKQIIQRKIKDYISNIISAYEKPSSNKLLILDVKVKMKNTKTE